MKDVLVNHPLALRVKRYLSIRRLRSATFIVVVSVVGVVTLMLSRAATPTADLEPESGTRSLAVSVGSDATASGGSFVKFGSGQAGGGGLPAGVTLRDIDGGANYFAQWSSTLPSDPNFFPIAVFSTYNLGTQVYTGMSRAASHKAIGINTYVHFANGPLDGSPTDMQIAKNNGMYAVVDPSPNVLTASFRSTYGSNAAAYGYQDEIDGSSDCTVLTDYYAHLISAPCTIGTSSKINPNILLNINQNLRAQDNTRPIYQGYTNAYAMDWYPGGPVSTLAAAGDIIGYDVYPMVDRRNSFGGQLTVGRPWGAFQTVTLARQHANFAKPIWPDVETSATDTDSGMNTTNYAPTPADIQALVWNYIIGGARGITYFNHCFCGAVGTSGHDDLNNPQLASNRAGVAAVNARIAALAPVINAPFADNYVTANVNASTKNLSIMAKWHNSTGYIFAIPYSSGAKTVEFTVAGAPNGTVTVVDESRTIPLSNGVFTDTFASENTVHIYRIN